MEILNYLKDKYFSFFCRCTDSYCDSNYCLSGLDKKAI